ncbi:MAG: DNA polymerase III subunit beta [Candidatus Berkelbacteria bacterium]|nr:DNA polymerase III subunit beta [Candidatus Berkelbacteria bacterium]
MMRISCTQIKLNKGLSIVSRIVGARTTLPVLSNIYLEAKNGQLKLSATDLEIGVTTSIGAKVDEEGSLTVPARLISDFIAANSDENLDIESKATTLHLKSARYEANIKGIDSSEYPVLPDISKDSLLELPVDEFTRAISEVVVACATDDTRPVLSGIYFKFEKDTLYLVATDSYRLAEKKINIPGLDDDREFIVPARTMQEVLRIASAIETTEKIGISATENQVSFTIAGTQIVSRLIEGSFPNYKQIIPISFKSSAEIELRDFSSAIKMASLFARQGGNNVKIKFAGSEVIITSIADQVGDNISNVPAVISVESEEITFNAKYIGDILQVLPDKKMIFEVNDKFSAGVIRPEKAKDFVYIIMPLRVEE